MTPRVLHYSDLEAAYDDPERVARLAGLIAERREQASREDDVCGDGSDGDGSDGDSSDGDSSDGDSSDGDSSDGDGSDGDEVLVVGSGDNTAPGVLSLVTRGRQAVEFFDTIQPTADTFGNHDFDYGLDAARSLVADSPQTWLSANVFDEAGDRFAAGEGAVPWTTVEVGDATVGLTGVTDPATADMSPAATDLAFSDPIDAVGDAVAALHADCDHVVCLSHLGSLDDELARDFDLDAVLGGHIHEERVETISGTVCTRPGPNGAVLLELDLATGDVTRHIVDDGPVHEPTLERFRELRANTGLTEVVAHVADPVRRERDLRRGGECRAGNFIADAYRWAGGTDVGLHNTGGIRDGPPLAGDVTVADLVSLVPFDEPVSIAELTGRELHAVVEEAYRAPHGQDYWYAHVSGMTIEYDTAAREVLAVTVGGEPLDPDRTYTAAMNDYLLHARREFPTLTRAHEVRALDTQYEVLAAYAREHGIDPRIEGRITLH